MGNNTISQYNPAYCAPDASLVLASSDGEKFRVHTNIMSMASEVFSDMLSKAEDYGEEIILEEKGDVLKTLLDMVYPDGYYFDLDSQTFDFIWKLLCAADKYNFRKVLQELRLRLTSENYWHRKPLEIFVVTSHFGWNEELRLQLTLDSLDYLNNPGEYTDIWDILAHLDDTYTVDLHKLVALRKERFVEGLHASIYGMDEDGLKDVWDARFGDKDTETDEVDYSNVSFIFLSLAEQEFAKNPSGRTLRERFWIRAEVSWLFSKPNGLFTVKWIVMDILNKIPNSLEDVNT